MTELFIIYIVKGVLEPWLSSSAKVYSSILDTLKSPQFSVPYSVELYEAFKNLPSGKERNCNEVRVVICHIDQNNEQEVLDRTDEFLWVLVSGGQHAVTESFREKMQHCHAIWFQGAYKREDNFAHWIRHWTKQNLDISSFRTTEDALFFAASGPILHLIKLQQNLQPLLIVIEGFSSLCHMTDIKIDAPMINELSMGICEVIKNPGILDMISSEATLLDGWLTSQKGLEPEPVKMIRDALYPLIPHDYGHFGDYNPKLDMDLIALAENRLPHQKAIEAVNKWRERLAVLFQPSKALFQ